MIIFVNLRQLNVAMDVRLTSYTVWAECVVFVKQVTKDISLTNHVPALKKSLETFVFRVKV